MQACQHIITCRSPITKKTRITHFQELFFKMAELVVISSLASMLLTEATSNMKIMQGKNNQILTIHNKDVPFDRESDDDVSISTSDYNMCNTLMIKLLLD